MIEIFDDELLDIYFEYVRLVLSANGYPRYGHYEMITKKEDDRMTENERFTVTAYEFYDNGEPILGEEVCKLLNELHEENKRLRKCINEIYTIARLEEV